MLQSVEDKQDGSKMNILTKLANRYGSDKGSVGPTDVWRGHNYTEKYFDLFEPMRDESIHLLEIGIGLKGDRFDANIVSQRNMGGASLKMWRDFFPLGEINGIDINGEVDLGDRIRTFEADQGDRERLLQVLSEVGYLDIIIDDGSHDPEDQQTALTTLWKGLVPGGYYIIEDLMLNGMYDERKNRAYSESVINTYDAFKRMNFKNTCLPEGLKEEIEQVEFWGWREDQEIPEMLILHKRKPCR